MSNLNLTEIPEILSSIINVDVEVSGVLISIFVVIISIVALGLLVENFFNVLPIVSVTIGWFTLFTFLGWFPIFPFLIISLLVAILYGKAVVSYIRGGENG